MVCFTHSHDWAIQITSLQCTKVIFCVNCLVSNPCSSVVGSHCSWVGLSWVGCVSMISPSTSHWDFIRSDGLQCSGIQRSRHSRELISGVERWNIWAFVLGPAIIYLVNREPWLRPTVDNLPSPPDHLPRLRHLPHHSSHPQRSHLWNPSHRIWSPLHETAEGKFSGNVPKN